MSNERFTMDETIFTNEYYIYDEKEDIQFPSLPEGVCLLFLNHFNKIDNENKILKNKLKEVFNVLKEQINEYDRNHKYTMEHLDDSFNKQRALYNMRSWEAGCSALIHLYLTLQEKGVFPHEEKL